MELFMIRLCTPSKLFRRGGNKDLVAKASKSRQYSHAKSVNNLWLASCIELVLFLQVKIYPGSIHLIYVYNI